MTPAADQTRQPPSEPPRLSAWRCFCNYVATKQIVHCDESTSFLRHFSIFLIGGLVFMSLLSAPEPKEERVQRRYADCVYHLKDIRVCYFYAHPINKD